MALSERELTLKMVIAATEHPTVHWAWDNAVTAVANLLEAVRYYDEKPGFWRGTRIDRREIDATTFLNCFITHYNIHVSQYNPPGYELKTEADAKAVYEIFKIKAKELLAQKHPTYWKVA